MSTFESTRRMTPKEQEIFDIGYAKGKADAAKHGKWVYGENGWHCNICNNSADFWSMSSAMHCSDYCPNCGARMYAEPPKEDET